MKYCCPSRQQAELWSSQGVDGTELEGLVCWEGSVAARGSELSALSIITSQSPLWEASQKTAQADQAFQKSFGS